MTFFKKLTLIPLKIILWPAVAVARLCGVGPGLSGFEGMAAGIVILAVYLSILALAVASTLVWLVIYCVHHLHWK